jgi:plastocyanin
VTAVVVLVSSACGGSYGGDPPTNPSPNPNPSQPTITITGAGVSPKELTINAGQRVLFVNNDSRAHEMTSDPHPDHGDCPAIDQVGFLNPGQTKETGNFVAAMSCGYHDHNLFDVVALQGRIIVR